MEGRHWGGILRGAVPGFTPPSPQVPSIIQGSTSLTHKLRQMIANQQSDSFQLVRIASRCADYSPSSPPVSGSHSTATLTSLLEGPSITSTSKTTRHSSKAPTLQYNKIRKALVQLNQLIFISNIIRYHKVQLEVQEQKAEINKLQETMKMQQMILDELIAKVKRLEQDHGQQENTTAHLAATTQHLQQRLGHTLEQTSQTMEEYTGIMHAHSHTMQEISNARHDHIIEICCVIVSLRVLHLPLTNIAVDWLQQNLDHYLPHKKYTHRVDRFLRLLLFLQVFWLIRTGSSHLDIPSRLYRFASWVGSAAQNMTRCTWDWMMQKQSNSITAQSLHESPDTSPHSPQNMVKHRTIRHSVLSSGNMCDDGSQHLPIHTVCPQQYWKKRNSPGYQDATHPLKFNDSLLEIHK